MKSDLSCKVKLDLIEVAVWPTSIMPGTKLQKKCQAGVEQAGVIVRPKQQVFIVLIKSALQVTTLIHLVKGKTLQGASPGEQGAADTGVTTCL